MLCADQWHGGWAVRFPAGGLAQDPGVGQSLRALLWPYFIHVLEPGWHS